MRSQKKPVFQPRVATRPSYRLFQAAAPQPAATPCNPGYTAVSPTAYYEIQQGESPASIAMRFRKQDVGPLLAAQNGTGVTFYTVGGVCAGMTPWVKGQLIRLPQAWVNSIATDPMFPVTTLNLIFNADHTPWIGRKVGRGVQRLRSGLVGDPDLGTGSADTDLTNGDYTEGTKTAEGQPCTPGSTTPDPNAWYRIQDGDTPASVAIRFNHIKGQYGDYGPLMAANASYPGATFVTQGGACVMSPWKSGNLIRVPKAWIDGITNDPNFPASTLALLFNKVGSQWTPPGKGCPPGQFPNPNDAGNCETPPPPYPCPSGQTFDVPSWSCQALATPSKTSPWVWVGVIGVVGVAGALIAKQLLSARKVKVEAPPAPKPEARPEVTIRR